MEPRVDIYSDVYERHTAKANEIINMTAKFAEHQPQDEKVSEKCRRVVHKAFDNAYYGFNDTLLYQLMDKINVVNNKILDSWLSELQQHVLIKFIRKYNCHKNYDLLGSIIKHCDVDSLKGYKIYHGNTINDTMTNIIELYVANDCKDFVRIAKHTEK